MMRSYVLVILSAVVFGGLFIVVWTMQPLTKSSAKEQAQVAPPAQTREKGYGPIKSGDVVWIKQYDRLGQLSSRFSGDQYLPQPDGTVKVTNPRAEFFLANHQRLQIDGLDGNVVMKDVPNLTLGGSGGGTPPAPPSRGRLNQVVVRLKDDLSGEDMLTMTTNNVVFDNETFRVFTEGYVDEQHNPVSADRVPVHVTGNLTMEGSGLTVRWNDKDGRLELLQIEHGDWLKIADPSALSFGGGKAGSRSSAAPTAQAGRPLPEMLADASNDGGGQILTHHPPIAKPETPTGPHLARTSAPIYHATFFNAVVVDQADPEGKVSLICMPWYLTNQVHLDHADRMDIDFLMKQSATAPATQPASTMAAQQPATAPAASTPAAPAPAAAPKTEAPIFIHWTGPLRITPAQSPPPIPLQSGDSMVVLVGEPVKIHRVEPKRQGFEDVKCARVLYATTGQKVWLDHSETSPTIYIDKTPGQAAKEQEPTHLKSSGQVAFSRIDSKAILSGVGTADVPLEPDPKTPHPMLNAAWTKQAVFNFTPESAGGQTSIQSGHFDGDVDIRHPKFALKSQALDLLFDPPTKKIESDATTRPSSSQPNLRQLIATTAVECQVEGSDGKKENITSNRLVLDTEKAVGRLYARHLNATGKAHVWGEDDLQAGAIDLLLNPTAKKAGVKSGRNTDDQTAQVELQKMVAHENVIALSKDGSRATGDDLVVTTVNGQQHTVLTSATNARVTDIKGNIVNGREIQFDSADGRAHVVGAGTLHAMQQASATQPAQPVDVAWVNEAIFDGANNRIDVDGAVQATSTDKKGFKDVANGHHIRIDLRPKPTTQPAVASGAADDATGPTTQPSHSGNLKMDPFKGKEVSAMTIEDEAKLTSTLRDSGGEILQQFELAGPTIIVNEFGPDGLPARTITVPAAGKMLARDHRPKAQPAAANDDASGARGATAFQWSKRLDYAEATHRSDMTGQVVVVHKDDDPNSPPARMTCEHVISWFEPAPKHAVGDKKPGDDSAQMQLRYLSAEGNPVVITRESSEVVARQVDFNPKTRILIATGTQQNPVTFTDGTAAGGVAERVEWDTVTWKIKAHNAIFDDRPPVPGVQSPPAKKKPSPLPTTPSSTPNGSKP
jgi:hypothetical protein